MFSLDPNLPNKDPPPAMEEDQTPDVEHARTRVLKRFHVAPSKRLGALTLSVLAVAIGVVAGLGAFAFRGLIGLCHNLLFLGRFSFAYDSNLHTPPGPWGTWVMTSPQAAPVPSVCSSSVLARLGTQEPRASSTRTARST